MGVHEFCLQKEGHEQRFGSARVHKCSLYSEVIGGRGIGVVLGFVGWLVVFWWGSFLFSVRVNNYLGGTLTLSAPGVGMRKRGIDIVVKKEGNC